MKFYSYLKEAYDFGFQKFGNYCEVFKNPTSDDLKEFKGKWLRFIIFDDNIYVWDADFACHDDIMRQLKHFYHEMTLGGVASVQGNKLKCETGYDLIIIQHRGVIEKIQKFKSYFANFNQLMSSLKERIGE